LKLNKIDINKDSDYAFLTKYVNDFLYLTIKPYEDIEIFKVDNMLETYILSSVSLIQQIKIIK